MMIIRIIRIIFFVWLHLLVNQALSSFFFLSLTPSLPEGRLCHVWWRLERVFDSKLSLSFICFAVWPSYWRASPGPIVAFNKHIDNIVPFYVTHSGFHTLLINHTLLCYSYHPPFNPTMLLCRCVWFCSLHAFIDGHVYQFISHSLNFNSLDFLKVANDSETRKKKTNGSSLWCGVSLKHCLCS